MLPEKYILHFPDGFTITPSAYNDFITSNHLDIKIQHLFGATMWTNPSSIEKTSKHIQKLMTDGLLSEDFVAEIFRAYTLVSGIMKDATVSLSTPRTPPHTIHGEATLLVTIKAIWAEHFQTTIITKTPNPQTLIREATAITVQKLTKKTYDKNPPHTSPVALPIPRLTATRVLATVTKPTLAEQLAQCYVDGIGLLQGDFIIQSMGTHPKHILRQGKRQKYVESLAQCIAAYTKPFSPRPVLYQISNLTTDEYRRLHTGDMYEPIEKNTRYGYRGASRYLQDPELFQLELDAVKMVRDTSGGKNLWLVLPFVRTLTDLVQVKKRITASGLYRSQSFKIWMTIEIPATVILLDNYLAAGIDGVTIHEGMLRSLLLGVDQDALDITRTYTSEEAAVLWAIEKVIKTAHRYKIPSSLYQTSPIHPQLLSRIVGWGISSVCVPPDAVENTRQHIAEIEETILKK